MLWPLCVDIVVISEISRPSHMRYFKSEVWIYTFFFSVTAVCGRSEVSSSKLGVRPSSNSAARYFTVENDGADFIYNYYNFYNRSIL